MRADAAATGRGLADPPGRDNPASGKRQWSGHGEPPDQPAPPRRRRSRPPVPPPIRVIADPHDAARRLARILTLAARARLLPDGARRSDLRAEKMISRRYRFLWLCNPKVASRSLIAALRAADPDAELFRGRTLGEVLARRPEARAYFSFAFVRHPVARTLSCFADKHALALHDRTAARWFIEPYHGLALGMPFGAFCRWLDTPFGSDAFADRHWLSQHRQIRAPDGRLPDFLGHWERLDDDWRTLTARLGMPYRPLPRLNARPDGSPGRERPGADAAAPLRRRYAEDFRIGGYDGTHDDPLPAGPPDAPHRHG